MTALAASHALHRALARWQVELVKEATAQGSSWEEVGAALEATKQAAWARFRHSLGEQGGNALMDSSDRRQALQRAREAWANGQARLREMDAKWRQEQTRLQQLVRQGQEELTKARRQHEQERRGARQALSRGVTAARKSG